MHGRTQAVTPNLCRPKLSASSILFQTQHGYSQKTIPRYTCAVLSYQNYIWNCDPGHGAVKNRDGTSKFWGTGYLLSRWVAPAFCYPRWQLPMCERMRNVKFPGAVPEGRCNLRLCPVTVWATAWDTGCDQSQILAKFPWAPGKAPSPFISLEEAFRGILFLLPGSPGTMVEVSGSFFFLFFSLPIFLPVKSLWASMGGAGAAHPILF